MATPRKVTCPVTKQPAVCGIDELTAEVRGLREELRSLREATPQAAQLESYAEMARQLSPVPDLLRSIERMLQSALASRTEDHEKVRHLEARVDKLEAQLTLLKP